MTDIVILLAFGMGYLAGAFYMYAMMKREK